MSVELQKRAAAEYAAGLVQGGMTVGLGSGTTAEIAVQILGQRFREGLRFVGVATSARTAEIATSFGIPLRRLDERSHLDINIDGADEFDPHLNLVKGRGGALTREKLVATAADTFVVIVDESKRVSRLGEKAPIPVEVVQFGWPTTRHRLELLGLSCDLRGGDVPYTTSNGNYILDCRSTGPVDLADFRVAREIKLQTGVVDHGLFLGMAALVVIGTDDGEIELLEAPR
ncbi:MAG TPA: ribose-5-phosphate isomerase RpiA [Chloroflexota bacterium]